MEAKKAGGNIELMKRCAFCEKITKPRGLHNHYWRYGKQPYEVAKICSSCHRCANALKQIYLFAGRDQRALRFILWSMPIEMQKEFAILLWECFPWEMKKEIIKEVVSAIKDMGGGKIKEVVSAIKNSM
jgi:hypothetical protein